MRSQRWKVWAGIGLLVAVGVLAAAALLGTRAGGGSERQVDGTESQPPSSAASAVCPSGSGSVSSSVVGLSSPSSPRVDAPPAAITDGKPWQLVFDDDFNSASATASNWASGMRSGQQTIESNHELQLYRPENSAVTTDDDGTGPVTVLRQTLEHQVTPDKMYTVRTLSDIYPPRPCASLYDPTQNNTPSPTNTNKTRTPYQYTSGMLNSSKSFGFKYGYVEARVKLPKGFGLWPALWLRDWKPWSYEIDVLEGFDASAHTFRTTYWWGNGQSRTTDSTGGDIGLTAGERPCRQEVPVPVTSAGASRCSQAGSVDLSQGYHTVGMWWTPTKYELFFDGEKRWESEPHAKIADAYNFLIVNLAFGNNRHEFDWNANAAKPLDPNLLDSAEYDKTSVEWDYVKVWQPPDAVDTCAPPGCG